MTEATPAAKHGADADLVKASQRWASAFSAAPLDPTDAADLVRGAFNVTRVVAIAARGLTWQTPDAFTAVMRQAEQANDC